MARRSTPLALNSQSKPSSVVSSRNLAAWIRRSSARWSRTSAGPAKSRWRNSRWLSDSFSAADNAASSASELIATPSVPNAVVTFSCKLGAAVPFVGGRRAGAGGEVAACRFVIVRGLAQQGLVVGGGSRRCRLSVKQPIEVGAVVVGQSIERSLGPAAHRKDAPDGLKAERAVPHGPL